MLFRSHGREQLRLWAVAIFRHGAATRSRADLRCNSSGYDKPASMTVRYTQGNGELEVRVIQTADLASDRKLELYFYSSFISLFLININIHTHICINIYINIIIDIIIYINIHIHTPIYIYINIYTDICIHR